MIADIPSPQVTDNPNRGEKMLLTFGFEGNFLGIEPCVAFELCYIPDRELITEADFYIWLGHLKAQKWASPEELCGHLVKQFYDIALPSHIELNATTTHKNGLSHKINHTKNQPGFVK